MNTTKISADVLADGISLKTLVNIAKNNHGIKPTTIMNILNDHSRNPDSVFQLYYIPEMNPEPWESRLINEPAKPRRTTLTPTSDGCGCVYRCDIEDISREFNFYPKVKTGGDFMEFVFISSSAYFEITGEKRPRSKKPVQNIKEARRVALEFWMGAKGYSTDCELTATKDEIWHQLQSINETLFRAGKDDFFKDNSDLIRFKTGRRSENDHKATKNAQTNQSNPASC